MRIRLRPIDWLEGYKEMQAAAMVERGIQRTLFSYGLEGRSSTHQVCITSNPDPLFFRLFSPDRGGRHFYKYLSGPISHTLAIWETGLSESIAAAKVDRYQAGDQVKLSRIP